MRADDKIDMCPRCKINEVAVDDFGVVLCQPCFDADPEAREYARQKASDEDILFGYGD